MDNNNYVSISDKNKDLRFFSYENEDSLRILISSGIIKRSNPINIDGIDNNSTENSINILNDTAYYDSEKEISLALSMNSYVLNSLTFRDNIQELKDIFNTYKIIPLEN